LGPLYFCCGIMAMVNDIQAMKPVYKKWYMDDGGIIGDVELLKKVWDLLQTRALGLLANSLQSLLTTTRISQGRSLKTRKQLLIYCELVSALWVQCISSAQHLWQCCEQASKFDGMIRNAIERSCGSRWMTPLLRKLV